MRAAKQQRHDENGEDLLKKSWQDWGYGPFYVTPCWAVEVAVMVSEKHVDGPSAQYEREIECIGSGERGKKQRQYIDGQQCRAVTLR